MVVKAPETPADETRELAESAERAAALLKSLANPSRLVVLCLLAERERKVGELEALLGLRQPTLSQQLARLRQDGLVATRRAGKEVWYRLADPNAATLVETLHGMFCAEGEPKPET